MAKSSAKSGRGRSAAALQQLRKKFGLGEYASKASKPTSRAVARILPIPFADQKGVRWRGGRVDRADMWYDVINVWPQELRPELQTGFKVAYSPLFWFN